MNLRYSYLTRDDYPALFRTFVEAFSDYVVDMSYMKEQNLLNRWIKNGVDFGASVGAFDGEKIVGFLMLGVDDWMGEPAAFDAGTGIIREFRGFGVAPAMFELAVRGLRQRGINQFLLEVIQSNKPAVRTYKKLGFTITREFDCFQLPLEKARLDISRSVEDIIVEPVGKDLLPVFESFADWQPSWENSFRSIERIPDEVLLYGARSGSDWIGFASYYPGLNWIMSVVVKKTHRRRGVATRLLSRLVGDLTGRVASVKFLNIDHSDQTTAAWAGGMGFEAIVQQYEMSLDVRSAALDSILNDAQL